MEQISARESSLAKLALPLCWGDMRFLGCEGRGFLSPAPCGTDSHPSADVKFGPHDLFTVVHYSSLPVLVLKKTNTGPYNLSQEFYRIRLFVFESFLWMYSFSMKWFSLVFNVIVAISSDFKAYNIYVNNVCVCSTKTFFLLICYHPLSFPEIFLHKAQS